MTAQTRAPRTAATRPATPATGQDPTSTVLAWNALVREDPPPPPPLPAAAPDKVSEDDPRVRYHARLGLVETTDIRKGLQTARRLLRLNGERRHPCSHVAIDSDCRGTGKRTLLHHIGLGFQGRMEKLYGIDDRVIPVVCLNTPPTPGSPADWSAAMAAFLGWDLYRSDVEGRLVLRMKDFTGPALHMLRSSRTRLCLIDGIDRLPTEDLQPTFDFFDYLTDELSLTIFWSGIGSSDILREARTARTPALRQAGENTATLRPRAVPTLWVNRLPPRSAEHPDEWVSAVATLDGKLRLIYHVPGTLLTYQKILYRITDGLMEHLAPLIGMAAQLAILDRSEALTLDVLRDAAAYLDLPAGRDTDDLWEIESESAADAPTTAADPPR
ncbi:hypothetical protein [Streptomyces atriruber]|uniref:hypothetical protein n=1 Tax=Streptomyces atriruber TaxID=545121 RepID=UPI0006E22652|nr:hypothetical protein [Streptomyces atriruber]